MVLFIIAIILFVVAAIALMAAIFSSAKVGAGITLVVSVILGLILMFFATFYQNSDGEAKVKINSVDRTVIGAVTTPGSGFKEPWVDFVEFDLFSQELVYAGGDQAPSYSGGTVNGSQITISVGGVNGGSTQGNMDATFVYSLDADSVTKIYKEYRSQERFVKQIIEKQVLSIARQVPSNYSATDFRGVKRAEAEAAIGTLLNERLNQYGVEFSSPTIQDVRYPDEVESALKSVEVANQKQQSAEAELRAAEITAQQKVVEAQAESDANRILTASLTPEVLQQRYFDTLKTLAAEGNLVITDGSAADIMIQR